MKVLLIDENLPPALFREVFDARVEVSSLSEEGLAGSTDAILWEVCLTRGWIIVTKDSDFLDLQVIAKSGRILLLKCGNMKFRSFHAWLSSRAETVMEFVDSNEPTLILT